MDTAATTSIHPILNNIQFADASITIAARISDKLRRLSTASRANEWKVKDVERTYAQLGLLLDVLLRDLGSISTDEYDRLYHLAVSRRFDALARLRGKSA